MEGLAHTSFWTLITESDLVILLVFVVLVAMSVATWALIIQKWVMYRRARRQVASDAAAFQAGTGLATGEADGPSGAVLAEGTAEIKRLQSTNLEDTVKSRVLLESVRNGLKDEVDVQSDKLFGSLSFLATCAAAAPLLGLFGTVWGIMDSFSSFAGEGAQALESVAPGLAAALGTTAAGLMVAIPAVLAYNLFLKMLADIERQLTDLSGTFLSRVKDNLSELLVCAPDAK